MSYYVSTCICSLFLLLTNSIKVPQAPNAPFGINISETPGGNVEFTMAFTSNSDGSSAIKQYSIYYGLNNDTNITFYKLFCSINGSEIAQLNPYTFINCSHIMTLNQLSKAYNFKVNAMNADGTSLFSPITPCIIPSNGIQYYMCSITAPPLQISNSSIKIQTTSYQINMEWNQTTSCNNIETPILSYQLQRTDFWTNTPFTNVTLPYNGLALHVQINGLLAGVPYDTRLRAINRYDASQWTYLQIITSVAGSCGNYYDTKILRDNCRQFATQAPGIWVSCNGNDECQEKAFENQYGFSSNCSSCWVQLNDCAMGVCVKQCLQDFNPQECETCIINKCSPQTEICTGYPVWPITCP
eukprot:172456_1